MPIPKALIGKNMFKPPVQFCEFAKKYGVKNVYFVDDLNCERSLRYCDDIFIKITGKWGNYAKYPFSSTSYPEMVILRFLHEIGHVYHKHSGSLKNLGRLNVRYQTDIWKTLMTGNEGEAWKFTFGFRKNHRIIYDELINQYQDFIKSYNFKCPITWSMNAEDELRKSNPGKLDFCPKWVIDIVERL